MVSSEELFPFCALILLFVKLGILGVARLRKSGDAEFGELGEILV